jgi:hypothetical protein
MSLYRGWVVEVPGQTVWDLQRRIAMLADPAAVRVLGPR